RENHQKCHDYLKLAEVEMEKFHADLRESEAWISRGEAHLREQREKLDKEKEMMQNVHQFQLQAVKLNVGGVNYDTSLVTLRRDPGSMLAAMFSGMYTLETDASGRYFIDRDGKHFDIVLNYLRDNQVERLPEDVQERVLREAKYYNLQGLIGL